MFCHSHSARMFLFTVQSFYSELKHLLVHCSSASTRLRLRDVLYHLVVGQFLVRFTVTLYLMSRFSLDHVYFEYDHIIGMLHSVGFTDTLIFGTVPPVFLCFAFTYYIMYQRGNALIWHTLDELVLENCDAFLREHKANLLKYRLTLTQSPLKLITNIREIVRIVLSLQTLHSMKRKSTIPHFSTLSEENRLKISQVWFFIEFTVQCILGLGNVA